MGIYRSDARRLPRDIRRSFEAVLGQEQRRAFAWRPLGLVKSAAPDEKMRVEGIANLAEPDRWDEVIAADAWRLDTYKTNPIVLREHNRMLAVGTCDEVMARLDGLYYSATIGDPSKAPLTECQVETRSLLAQGILRTNSVGFLPHLIEWDEDADVLRYTDVDLLEISFVAIPMQQGSLITAVKGWRAKAMAGPNKGAAPAGGDEQLDQIAAKLAATHELVAKLAAEGDTRAAALAKELAEVKAALDAKTKAHAALETKAKQMLELLQKRGLLKPAA